MKIMSVDYFIKGQFLILSAWGVHRFIIWTISFEYFPLFPEWPEERKYVLKTFCDSYENVFIIIIILYKELSREAKGENIGVRLLNGSTQSATVDANYSLTCKKSSSESVH